MQAEIEALLNNDETKVVDIFALDDQEKQDEILNSLNGGSKFAVKFFTKKQSVHELIDLITSMPPEDADHARGHKYPFLASQVFSDGGDGVIDIL